MFTDIVQIKSVPHQQPISVNRGIAVENRMGTRPSFKNSFLAQFAEEYAKVKNPRLFRGELKVNFKEEKGDDGGGPSREFIAETAVDMQSPTSGLFIELPNGYFIPQPHPQVENPDFLYHVVGVVLGIIVRTGVLQPFNLAPFFWRFFSKPEIFVEDIFELDEEYKRQTEFLVNIDEAEFSRQFSQKKFVETDFFGHETELKEGYVTFSNISEFISSSTQFKISLLKGNMTFIRQGFLENLDLTEVPDWVTGSLLEICVCGYPKISFKALRRVISMDEITSSLRELFLKVVENFSNEQRSKLLKFVTGRVRLPRYVEGQKLFKVVGLYGGADKCPQASTCFNQLALPPYTSLEQAERMIKMGIEMGTTFENK
jgi:hypothetical protein